MRCFPTTAIATLLCCANLAATYDTSVLGRLTSEGAFGNDRAYPALTVMTGHPFLWLAADGQARFGPGTAGLALNSGRLYPVAPTDSVSRTGNHERYYVDRLYLAAGTGPVEVAGGRLFVEAAGGRLSSANVPALRLAVERGPARVELVAAKSEAQEFIDLDSRSHWYQSTIAWTFPWWRTEAGVQHFRDPSGQFADLLNPLWPVALFTIPTCEPTSEDPNARRRCLVSMASRNGFLVEGRTRLTTAWVGASGLAGPMDLAADLLFQAGSSDLLAADFDGRGERLVQQDQQAWAAHAAAIWVGRRWEAEVAGLWLQGASEPLTGDFTSFIGVQSFWTDTTLFFGGGINSDLQTATYQTPGRLGYGVRAAIAEARVFLADWYGLLRVAPLWSDRPFDLDAVPSARERFYGLEIDLRTFYAVTDWLTLFLDGAWLGGGDFPAFDPGATLSDSSRRPFAAPAPVWTLSGGVEVNWERAWTTAR